MQHMLHSTPVTTKKIHTVSTFNKRENIISSFYLSIRVIVLNEDSNSFLSVPTLYFDIFFVTLQIVVPNFNGLSKH